MGGPGVCQASSVATIQVLLQSTFEHTYIYNLGTVAIHDMGKLSMKE